MRSTKCGPKAMTSERTSSRICSTDIGATAVHCDKSIADWGQIVFPSYYTARTSGGQQHLTLPPLPGVGVSGRPPSRECSFFSLRPSHPLPYFKHSTRAWRRPTVACAPTHPLPPLPLPPPRLSPLLPKAKTRTPKRPPLPPQACAVRRAQFCQIERGTEERHSPPRSIGESPGAVSYGRRTPFAGGLDSGCRDLSHRARRS